MPTMEPFLTATHTPRPEAERLRYLGVGGEMSDLTVRHDWGQTSVGPIETWSLTLRTLVRLMLASRFPKLIFWNRDLVTFYNDAFRPSLNDNGKHPGSLGQPGHISWAESWPTIGPMIQNIMAGGEAVYFENQKLPIWRDGFMDYAYWTYSFSPLTDDVGAVNGVLVTCLETTDTMEHLEYFQSGDAEANADANPNTA